MNALKTYTVTSILFPGSIDYRYNAQNQLQSISFSDDVTWPVAQWFMKYARATPEELSEWVNSEQLKLKKLQLIVSDTQLTFEMIYKAYGVFKDRKRSQDKWDKLDYSNQLRAFLYIPKYNQELKLNGRQKMELKTYLSAQIWNDIP